ncbi:hypothetical protein MTR_2g064200 [Medicago truncatula]|uniref:Uncharacterized protein n=1 Tax=Medicago truncatula TaxID=3880 RepID=G7IGX1_MEDTR|nr:hypothetical protein MTR_2g064200 [Medicago truncatula]
MFQTNKVPIKHFDLLDVRLLTLPRPLRADVHGDFHSIGTDPFPFWRLQSPISIRWNTLIQPIGSPFRGPTLNESTNC